MFGKYYWRINNGNEKQFHSNILERCLFVFWFLGIEFDLHPETVGDIDVTLTNDFLDSMSLKNRYGHFCDGDSTFAIYRYPFQIMRENTNSHCAQIITNVCSKLITINAIKWIIKNKKIFQNLRKSTFRYSQIDKYCITKFIEPQKKINLKNARKI